MIRFPLLFHTTIYFSLGNSRACHVKKLLYWRRNLFWPKLLWTNKNTFNDCPTLKWKAKIRQI